MKAPSLRKALLEAVELLEWMQDNNNSAASLYDANFAKIKQIRESLAQKGGE